MYKTTKKDIEVFQAECNKWIEYFGLKNWVHREICGKTEQGDSAADCDMDFPARLGVLTLNTTFEVRPTRDDIKYYAFHEVCHLMISGLARYAYGFAAENAVAEAEHKIIATLTNTVFKDLS